MGRKGNALVVFLDVSAAFDNLDAQKGVKAMEQKGIISGITDWYGHYLSNRISHVAINGASCSKLVKKGCPQGGVQL